MAQCGKTMQEAPVGRATGGGADRMRRRHVGLRAAVVVAVLVGVATFASEPAGADHVPGHWKAVQSGNWNDPGTWGGEVPQNLNINHNIDIPPGIAVTIPAGHIVFMQLPEVRVQGFLFVGGFFRLGGLSVSGSGEVYVQGGDMVVSREIANFGKLVNNGELKTAPRTVNSSSGVFRNLDRLTLAEGQFAAHGFFNQGVFENAASVVHAAISETLFSRFVNEDGGLVTNQATGGIDTGEGSWINHSIVDHYGTLANTGTFDNTNGEVRARCSSVLTGNALLGTPARNWCDSTSPIVEVPGAITQEATGPDGAAVDFTVIAKDNLDPAPVIDCDPSSGATFPLGTTTVSCTATDYVGNGGAGSFQVTVVDTTAPVLTLIGDIDAVVVQHNAYVDPGATAVDAVDGDRTSEIDVTGTVNVDLPGTYTISYSVADVAGNTAIAERTVNVITAAVATELLLDDIRSLELPRSAHEELLRPTLQIQRLLDDGNSFNDGTACHLLDTFAGSVLRHQRRSIISADQATALLQEASQLKTALSC